MHGALGAACGEDEDGEDETEEEDGEKGFHCAERACVQWDECAWISSSMLTTDFADDTDMKRIQTRGTKTFDHSARRSFCDLFSEFVPIRVIRGCKCSKRSCVRALRMRNSAAKGNETRVRGGMAEDVRGSADACFTPSRVGVMSDA
ncbi:hypothetical protein ASA1KI_19850 [Opitutales bacterium ASA1]|nr:hypothetical protein ASA1KI_19850 [Opitutales bacterium ASA1]